jgi:tryptophan synthase beta chain
VMVYMVKVSYEQKPYRRALMETWGASVLPSPTDRTQVGRAILEKDPQSPGSLGIAISEAVEDAATREDTHYSLGSVVNHVLLHQTVIGLEAQKQMEMADAYPDVVIGCVGGGSNFAGLAYPFLADKITGRNTRTRFLAAEPAACPTLTRGIYAYDFGDTAGMGPVVPMYTLGHNFVPDPIHAGGLRYHGDAPSLCLLVKHGLVEARAYKQNECFAEAVRFARTEGFLPGPEPAHALRAVVEEAAAAREAGEARTILFNLSGHGHFDLSAYDAYFAGTLQDVEFPQERLDSALGELPQVQAATV